MSKTKPVGMRDKYTCPSDGKTYYFLKPSIRQIKFFGKTEKVKEDDDLPYGGALELLCAAYFALSCDSKGVKKHKGCLTKPETLQHLVDDKIDEPGFFEHMEPAANYAIHGRLPKETDLVSSVEGSVEAAKKPS